MVSTRAGRTIPSLWSRTAIPTCFPLLDCVGGIVFDSFTLCLRSLSLTCPSQNHLQGKATCAGQLGGLPNAKTCEVGEKLKFKVLLGNTILKMLSARDNDHCLSYLLVSVSKLLLWGSEGWTRAPELWSQAFAAYGGQHPALPLPLGLSFNFLISCGCKQHRWGSKHATCWPPQA